MHNVINDIYWHSHYNCVIHANGCTLEIVYEAAVGNCLAGYFKSDDEMKDFIQKNPQMAYQFAVTKVDDTTYFLNVVSVENYGAFPLDSDFGKKLIKEQTETFMPLIKMFLLKKPKLANELDIDKKYELQDSRI